MSFRFHRFVCVPVLLHFVLTKNLPTNFALHWIFWLQPHSHTRICNFWHTIFLTQFMAMVRSKSISLPNFACIQWFISCRLEIESQRKFPITAMFLIHILQNHYLKNVRIFLTTYSYALFSWRWTGARISVAALVRPPARHLVILCWKRENVRRCCDL
jgi:hypothetical protein